MPKPAARSPVASFFPIVYSIAGPGLTLYQNTSGLGYSAIRKGHGEALCHWEPEPYCLPGDDYARSIVKEVLRAPKDRPLRVLLLGLGCGAIAAGIVHGLIEGHTLTAIDAIEYSGQIMSIAKQRFLPSMDSCYEEQRVSTYLRMIKADALRPRAYPAAVRGEYTHILVDLPQVYLYHDRNSFRHDEFWESLGHLGIPDATLIVNTWYTSRTRSAGALRGDLVNAGWGSPRAFRTGPNTLWTARDWRSPDTFLYWTRIFFLRHAIFVNERIVLLIVGLWTLCMCCYCISWCCEGGSGSGRDHLPLSLHVGRRAPRHERARLVT